MVKEIVAALALAAFSAPLAFADVAILNDQKYRGDDGFFHIVGEVHNGIGAPIGQVVVDVTLYDGSGGVMATKQTGSLVNMVMPGMKGPFDLIVDGREGERIHSYDAQVSYRVAAPKSQVIDIVSSELSRDSHDNLLITGIVANRGEITANTVSVVATLYDGQGNVAAVSWIRPEPDYLRADGEAFFLVPIPDKEHAVGIDDYSLVAESEEYAAVPEFSAGAAVLLAGSVSAYIGVSRYSGSVIAGPASAASPE